MNKMKKISIIIPAHNEEKRIGKTLEEYIKYFKKLKDKKKLDFEIIVVLNACKDNTGVIVSRFKCKELKILDFEQGGKGFAIIEGFKEALKGTSHLIGFVDADMATSPEEFHNLTENIGNYDGVIANRWDRNSIIKTRQNMLRRVMSRGFNMLIRSLLLMPYKDTQCGAKLFKREVIEKIISELNITKWAFDINLLYSCKKKRFNIKQIKTIWEDKKESKLSVVKVPFQMFSSVIRIRLLNSPFKFVVKAYNKIPEKLRIHNW